MLTFSMSDICEQDQDLIGHALCENSNRCGNDWEWPRTETFTDCDALCQQNSACLFFTWMDANHPTEILRKTCWLKDEVSSYTPDDNMVSGPQGCAGTGDCMAGNDIEGHFLCEDVNACGNDWEWPRVESYAACDYMCLLDEQCTFFTFFDISHPEPVLRKTCWLKDRLDHYEAKEHLVSGAQGCNIQNPDPTPPPTPGELIFEENFDTLDESKWKHFVSAFRGGNHEFQYYRNNRKNSYTEDGMLVIKPTLTADEYGEDFLYNGELNLWEEGCDESMNIENGCDVTAGGDYIIPPIQSAKLVTSESFRFTYGVIEVRAKMPKGDWIWPAIWLLPADSVYGTWPASGEIDLCESKGNDALLCEGELSGHQLMGSTLHWGPDFGQNRYDMTLWDKTNLEDPFGDSFHTFKFQWDKDGFTFLVDDEQIGETHPPAGGFWEMGGFEGKNVWEYGTKMAPFDRDFYFILNVAAGGNFFSDECENLNGPKPWAGKWVPGAMKSFWEGRDQWQPTWSDQSALVVDYVKVWSTA